MDLNRLVIAEPSGNTTALVFDRIQNIGRTAEIIQNEFPSVEQVLFVRRENGITHGEMAGGEFCANAARSLGYVLSGGRTSVQHISLSGAPSHLTVHTSPGRAILDVRLMVREELRPLGGTEVPLMHFGGISFGIITKQSDRFDILRYGNSFDEPRVRSAMTDLGLASMIACGLLFVEEIEIDKVKITPFIFVRNTETFYAETACASGSIAISTFMNKNLSILQPSGKFLDVKVSRSSNFVDASVGGDIFIKWDGPVNDLGTHTKPLALGLAASHRN